MGFSQAIMLDLRKHDIKVTTIMPGSVATEFNDHKVSDKDAWKIQPEDIGEIVSQPFKHASAHIAKQGRSKAIEAIEIILI